MRPNFIVENRVVKRDENAIVRIRGHRFLKGNLVVSFFNHDGYLIHKNLDVIIGIENNKSLLQDYFRTIGPESSKTTRALIMSAPAAYDALFGALVLREVFSHRTKRGKLMIELDFETVLGTIWLPYQEAKKHYFPEIVAYFSGLRSNAKTAIIKQHGRALAEELFGL